MYHKDTQEELERLEAELLEDTEEETEIPAEDIENIKVDDVLSDPVIRGVMEELEEQEATRIIPEMREAVQESEEVISEYTDAGEEVPTEHTKGLLITALCLSVGILAILGWWLIRYPGLFL